MKSVQSSSETQHRKAKEEARGLEERLQEMKEEVCLHLSLLEVFPPGLFTLNFLSPQKATL